MPIDPAVAAILAESAASDPAGIETLTPEEARRRGSTVLTTAQVPHEEVAEVRDVVVPAAAPIPARLYHPHGATGALLVYFHGGGWVIGGVAGSDAFSRALANRSGCAVLSVEYRLAPEYRYPAALDDAYAAASWAVAEAKALAADPARVGVGGSSAGGNLAAAVALAARDRGGPRLAAQLLHVPVLDHDFTTASYRANADGFGLTLAAMRWFWDHYLPDVARRGDPLASPLRAMDLRGLPSALVVTAEYDPLHDEGAAYAARLRAAGVPVEHLDVPGMVHSFLSWPSAVPRARRAFDEVGALLRAMLR